jgi:uncharacterized damage-inducible protein DinB
MTIFSIDLLRELFHHMEWADAEVWRAVLATDAARHDIVLRDLLLHLHGVQGAFVNLWAKRPMSFPDASQLPDVAAVRTWVEPNYRDAFEHLGRVDPGLLEERQTMPWLAALETQLGRPLADPTLGETMFQVTSHSTYHRGQVNARLRAVGGQPPLVDYIAWVWFGKPGADWSAASVA